MIGHVSYLVLCINPIGGMLASVPFGILQMKYSPWYVLATAPLLSYVQVLFVDLAWNALNRWHWFRLTLEKKRSGRVERLVSGEGRFWAVFVATPIIGPWVIMAFMRYAHVPQRTVMLPMLASLYAVGAALVVGWAYTASLGT